MRPPKRPEMPFLALELERFMGVASRGTSFSTMTMSSSAALDLDFLCDDLLSGTGAASTGSTITISSSSAAWRDLFLRLLPIPRILAALDDIPGMSSAGGDMRPPDISTDGRRELDLLGRFSRVDFDRDTGGVLWNTLGTRGATRFEAALSRALGRSVLSEDDPFDEVLSSRSFLSDLDRLSSDLTLEDLGSLSLGAADHMPHDEPPSRLILVRSFLPDRTGSAGGGGGGMGGSGAGGGGGASMGMSRDFLLFLLFFGDDISTTSMISSSSSSGKLPGIPFCLWEK